MRRLSGTSERLRRKRRRSRRFDHGQPISKIDLRPMVFVALFLAILFLIPATQTRVHALLIDLPQGSDPELAPKVAYMTLEISAVGVIALDGRQVALAELGDVVRVYGPDYPTVLVSPSPDAPFEIVALAINELVTTGVARSEICFDRLKRFGTFQRSALITDFGPTEPLDLDQWSKADDVAPSGCEQFVENYYEPI